jgi:hypothetical protein
VVLAPAIGFLAAILSYSTYEADLSAMTWSSTVEMAIILVGPVVLLLSAVASLSAGLGVGDIVPRASFKERLLRVLSVTLAIYGWSAVAWLGIWLGAAVLAMSNGGSILPIMALPGFAALATSVVIGVSIGASRLPRWTPVMAALLWYAVLVGVSYLAAPHFAVIPRYGELMMPAALPNPAVIIEQVTWAASFCGAMIWMVARGHGRLSILALLGAVAALLSVAANHTTPYLARAGVMDMTCQPHAAVEICLWEDHEGTRQLTQQGVDLALDLAGDSGAVAYVAEGDNEDLPPPAVPTAKLDRTVIIPPESRQVPRNVAAVIIADLVTNDDCPGLAFVGLPGLPAGDVVAEVVRSGSLPWSQAPLPDVDGADVAPWIRTVRASVAACRSPELP